MRAHNLLHPGRARRFAVPGMLVAAVAAAFAAPSTASAAQQVRAELRNGTLVVTGSDRPESIALRLRAGRPDKLQVVVNNNVRAMIKLDIVNRILVEGGRGSDTLRIDETNGAFTPDKPTALNGQAGHDTLIGGSGAETFRGGNGNDFADGNRGDDEALLGAGNDVFRWDPGDGNDRIEGGAARDAMLFIGSGANERIDISANGERVRFFRDVANVTMDLDDTEEIEFEALGGADNVVVNDLSGTDVVNVITDLEGVLGSNAGDGQPDTIVARGTNGDDVGAGRGSGRADEADRSRNRDQRAQRRTRKRRDLVRRKCGQRPCNGERHCGRRVVRHPALCHCRPRQGVVVDRQPRA